MKTHRRTLIILGFCLAMVADVHAQVITSSLSIRFDNPTPEIWVEEFGLSVAALGVDRVLIGARQDNASAFAAGAAYLFGTNGILLMTFTNPTPTPGANFGSSVAAVGTDKILIGTPRDDTGASDAGVAYLFSTNGTLLTIFTNPVPTTQEYFGVQVAGVTADIVLISALAGRPSTPGLGAAYLYSSDGTLITTITNPNPTGFADHFGTALAAMGTDRVLVGSTDDTVSGNRFVGVAYLFGTNGTRLCTFTNPAPTANDAFGVAVAALGTDRVIIGALVNGTAGAAYVFSTNGTLLATLVSPDPAANEFFGSSIAVLSEDLILIGARQDTPGFSGNFHTGTAYLFNTNGTLLRTISNPSPSPNDHFGRAVAVIGSNQVLVGAEQKAIGGMSPGAAYLFNLTFLPAPTVSVAPVAGGNVRISWPRPSTGFVLDRTTNFVSPLATNVWNQMPFPYQTNATQISVTVAPTTNQFFRLRQP